MRGTKGGKKGLSLEGPYGLSHKNVCSFTAAVKVKTVTEVRHGYLTSMTVKASESSKALQYIQADIATEPDHLTSKVVPGELSFTAPRLRTGKR